MSLDRAFTSLCLALLAAAGASACGSSKGNVAPIPGTLLDEQTVKVTPSMTSQVHLGSGDRAATLEIPTNATSTTQNVQVALSSGVEKMGATPANGTVVQIVTLNVTFILPVALEQMLPPAPPGKIYRAAHAAAADAAWTIGDPAKLIGPASIVDGGSPSLDLYSIEVLGTGIWTIVLVDAADGGGGGGQGGGGAGGMDASIESGEISGSDASSPEVGGTSGADSGATASDGGAACPSACDAGSQCVAASCQACGMAQEPCCGNACGTNLMCVSGTCSCGGASEPCCGGSTCNAGFSCDNGSCACGGVNQACCAGKTCNGSLICGGTRCGCTTVCDQGAALKGDGSIWAIGSLTAITNADSTTFTHATSLSVGPNLGCVLKNDQTVWCWGDNTYGALGNGDTSVTSSWIIAVQVVTAVGGPALTGVTAFSVSDNGYTGCAIGAGGAIWCWGLGNRGQLGNGYTNNSSFAVPVLTDVGGTPVTGFKQISVGGASVCAIKNDGTLWCWGNNVTGAVGNAAAGNYVLYPSQVSALTGSVTSVATGYYADATGNREESCASLIDGTAWCWGEGISGNGTGTGVGVAGAAPKQVIVAPSVPLTNVSKIVSWQNDGTTQPMSQMCAVKTDGTVWCWGDTAAPLTDSASMPVQVSSPNALGRLCYLDTTDQIWLMGTKSAKQLTCP